MTALLEYLDPDCSIREYQSFKQVFRGPLMGPPAGPLSGWGLGNAPVAPPPPPPPPPPPHEQPCFVFRSLNISSVPKTTLPVKVLLVPCSLYFTDMIIKIGMCTIFVCLMSYLLHTNGTTKLSSTILRIFGDAHVTLHIIYNTKSVFNSLKDLWLIDHALILCHVYNSNIVFTISLGTHN